MTGMLPPKPKPDGMTTRRKRDEPYLPGKQRQGKETQCMFEVARLRPHTGEVLPAFLRSFFPPHLCAGVRAGTRPPPGALGARLLTVNSTRAHRAHKSLKSFTSSNSFGTVSSRPAMIVQATKRCKSGRWKQKAFSGHLGLKCQVRAHRRGRHLRRRRPTG